MAITMKDSAKFPLVIAKILLSNLCLWPLDRSWVIQVLKYVLLVNMIITGSAHLTYMLRNITDMAVMASTCTTVSTTVQTASKMLLISYYSDDLTEIITTISNEFWPADSTDSMTEQSILFDSRKVVLMACIFFSSAFMSCWDYMAIPLVYGRRILPLESSYPFRWDWSPLYEIIYVWQFISASYSIVHTILSHDLFFNSLVQNAIAQFKLLKAALRTVGTKEGLELNRKLKHVPGIHNQDFHLNSEEEEQYELVIKCIAHHIKVLNVCDNLERIFRKIILLQFFLSATAICVSTFVLTKYENYLSKMLSFSAAHLMQFFFLSAVGNQLIHESVEIAEAAYASEWYNKAFPEVRRAISLIIVRARREQKITALGFANLDFPNFINVLRVSFSFYTLLSSFEE